MNRIKFISDITNPDFYKIVSYYGEDVPSYLIQRGVAHNTKNDAIEQSLEILQYLKEENNV